MSNTTLSQGQLLQSRYRVLQHLGSGGMGVVHVAEDARLAGKTVAVKELSTAAIPPADRAEALQDFQKEAHILAQLDHPGLTKVTDLFTEGGRWYLVMEYVAGETLETVAQRRGGRVSEQEAAGWARQLCDVLAYLHARNPPVIFRDLKPDNIMLMPDGRLKLIDFGIARFFKPGQTRDTRNMGTPGFAAPEQYGTGQTDGRSDIYSLGVTLHTLLTGHNPAQTPFMLPVVRSLNPAVSQAMEQLIRRAARLDAAQRYQNVEEVRRALTAPAQASPLHPWMAARRPDTPTAVHATRVKNDIRVTWTASKADGGSPITGYTVIASPGGHRVAAGRFATDATFSGLAENTSYTFTVTATNVVGNSAPSSTSNKIRLPAARFSGRRAGFWGVVFIVAVIGAANRWVLPQLWYAIRLSAPYGFLIYGVQWAFTPMLAYFLTHRAGAVLLTYMIGGLSGGGFGALSGWISVGVMEGVLALSGWRTRSAIVAGVAGILGVASSGLVFGWWPLDWSVIVGAGLGGMLAAILGRGIGRLTGIGR